MADVSSVLYGCVMTPLLVLSTTPSPGLCLFQFNIPKLQSGSVVLAKWAVANARKYPAIVKSVKPKSMLTIEFYDGVESDVHLSTVQRLTTELQSEVSRFLLLCI